MRSERIAIERRLAAKGALLCMYAKLKNPNPRGLGFADSTLNSDEISLGVDPVAAELMEDEEIKMVESERPNPEAEPFIRIVDRDLAAGTGVLSYYTLTGDYARTTYGSLKGAQNVEAAQVEPIQEWFGRSHCLPVRTRWNELAAAVGYFKNVSARQYVAERERFNRFDIIGPSRGILDPDRETSGTLKELRGMLTTLKYACARRNKHWLRVLRQCFLETTVTGALNLSPDFGEGGGGTAGRDTRRAIDEAVREALASVL